MSKREQLISALLNVRDADDELMPWTAGSFWSRETCAAIMADAVLAVLREPTPEMLEAAHDNLDWGPGGMGDDDCPDATADAAWRIMIDHISKPGEPAGDG
jgi:hypothetical protein